MNNEMTDLIEKMKLIVREDDLDLATSLLKMSYLLGERNQIKKSMKMVDEVYGKKDEEK